MISNLIVLGSTGSIGTTTLNCVRKKKNIKVVLLSANKNIKKLYNQSLLHKVKNVIIEDEKKYLKYKNIFKKKKIKLHLGFKNINKILKKKATYSINSISGIDGLEPTLKIIPFSKKILIANKETIICAWELIKKKLNKHNCEFIPIDSEHFSIWNLIRNDNDKQIDKIILTASGGPFLKKKKSELLNIKPKVALNHPNWKMGKKISIDSSTMMNKIFEFIEAKKIFNLSKRKLSIIIHPHSYVHAIVFFKSNIMKLLAHETNMSVPIKNALEIYEKSSDKKIFKQIDNLNFLKFEKPNVKQFPLLSIINLIPNHESFFETILITINDNLVKKYLNNKINYISIHQNLLRLIKSPIFIKYYKLKPKNFYDIKRMVNITNIYIEKKIKHYER